MRYASGSESEKGFRRASGSAAGRSAEFLRGTEKKCQRGRGAGRHPPSASHDDDACSGDGADPGSGLFLLCGDVKLYRQDRKTAERKRRRFGKDCRMCGKDHGMCGRDRRKSRCRRQAAERRRKI